MNESQPLRGLAPCFMIHETYLLTPPPVSVPYDPLWSENKPQQIFHGSPAKYRLLRGGGGGGKTIAGIMETVLTMVEYPGTEGMIGRWNYPRLSRTTWKDFVAVCDQARLIADRSNDRGKLFIKFHNGSLCWGINLQDYESITSLNLGFFYIDECTEIRDPEVFRQAQLRLRHPFGPGRGWLTGYSGGQDWLQCLFDNDKSGRYHYIKVSARDNLKCLPPTFENDLRADHTEKWVRKYLDGEVDMWEGLIFPDFNTGIHVVPPFIPPTNWPRFRGMDHGWTHPTTCLWATTDSSGNIYIYDEYVKSRSSYLHTALDIIEKTGNDHVEWTVIDPSTNQHTTATGRSHKDEYQDSGISPIFYGINRIHDSIARLEKLFEYDLEKGIKPKLYITSNCTNLIEELQQWRWKETKVAGVFDPKPVDKFDDCIAALRYIVMQNPRPAYIPDELDSYQRMVLRMQELAEEAREEDNSHEFLYSTDRKAHF